MRRLLGDDHVLDVALTETSGGEAHDPGLRLEFFQVGDAAVTHSAAKPGDELLHQTAERTLMGYAAFHPFRHGLAALGRVLEIAVAGARFHGAERTHAAIGLERAALVENGFSRRLFRARKETPDHHHRGACGNGLGDVAGKFYSPVGDYLHARSLGGPP